MTPRTILLSGYTGLGHFVLKSVLIQHLGELYPDAKILIVAGNRFGTEHVLSGYETLLLKPTAGLLEQLAFFWKLRRRRIDVALLPCDASPAFLLRGCLLAGIRERVGHVLPGVQFPPYYLTKAVVVRVDGPRSEIDLNLDLLEALHGRSFTRTYRPRIDADARLNPIDGRYVAVQIGAANGLPTTKRWLEPYFRELIARLLAAGQTIVAIGDSGDAPIAQRVCCGLDSPRLIDLTGRSSIAEVKAVIAGADLLVCHDSGLMHMGNALGTPVIALYGPSDPDEYALKIASFLVLRESCDCPKAGLFPGSFTVREDAAAQKCPVPMCMQRLTVDRVYSACAGVLDQANQSAQRMDAACTRR